MKHLVTILAVLLAGLATGCSCSDDYDEIYYDSIEVVGEGAAAATTTDTAVVWHRLTKRNFGGSYGRVFNDVNDEHLAAARRIGIKPIASLYEAYNLSVPIVKIESCEDFTVDPLTHSVPYLVPQAAQLLHDIGRSFTDTVAARGAWQHKIIVTSVTRTDHSVASLRRHGNVNATQESAHRYATTVDISYRRYECADSSHMVWPDDLKHILGEVLAHYQAQGRCLVKHEVKQGCFHITATGR